MPLQYCTLTGIDEHTDLHQLRQLSAEYPFVEWGILYSERNAGAGRYPSLAWIESFIHQATSWELEGRQVTLALHVCGQAALQNLLHNKGLVSRLIPGVHRVQLNFKADERSPAELAEVQALLNRHPLTEFITQHNAANAILRHLLCQPNHTYLFDESGGRGQAPDSWPLAFPSSPCGYAGGLGSHNVAEQLPLIQRQARGMPYWVDMESSLRDTNDRFSLDQAEQVLRQVESFLDQTAQLDTLQELLREIDNLTLLDTATAPLSLLQELPHEVQRRVAAAAAALRIYRDRPVAS